MCPKEMPERQNEHGRETCVNDGLCEKIEEDKRFLALWKSRLDLMLMPSTKMIKMMLSTKR